MAHKTASTSPCTLLLATASSLIAAGMPLAGPASAEKSGKGVTWEDILNDQSTNDDVLMYGMGVKAQRYSTLERIAEGADGWREADRPLVESVPWPVRTSDDQGSEGQ
ncbi:hypothetical protein [uncultured Methylobacterium sp.]|uniref:hypothetical protein n=1 Tax=uncultured Methylobacterium sp. TaxID=157278 RepID=UPI0035CA01F2